LWGEALDGLLYSRSLEAMSAYYIRLSNCGGTATLVAATENIPFGPLLDPWPTDPRTSIQDFGYYGWPSLVHTDRTQEIVDPLTGGRVKKVTLPTDSPRATSMSARTLIYASSTGTNWTTPTATDLDDAGLTKAFTDTQDILFIPRSDNNNTDDHHYQMVLTAKAWMSAGTGEELKAQVCICSGTGAMQQMSDWQDITLTTSLATYTVGDTTGPLTTYWMHGKSHLPEGLWNGTATVRGFCFRKKVASAGVLNIDFLSFTATLSEQFGNSTSLPNNCAPSFTTDPSTGTKRWVMCYFADRSGSGGGRFYSFSPDDGEAHYLGPMYFSATTTGLGLSSGAALGSVAWGGPRTFYWTYNSTSPSESRVIKCVAPMTSGLLTTDSTVAYTSSVSPPWLQTPTCSVITPSGFRLEDQALLLQVNGQSHPHYSTYWQGRNAGAWQLSHVSRDEKIYIVGAGAQAIGKWLMVFDPNATPPASCFPTPGTCVGAVVALAATGISQGPSGLQAGSDLSQGCKFNVYASIDNLDWIGIGCSRQATTSSSETQNLWGGPYSVITASALTASNSDTVVTLAAQDGHYDFKDQFGTGAGSDTDDDRMPLIVGSVLAYAPTGSDTDAKVGLEHMEVVSISEGPPRVLTLRRGTDIVNSPYFAGLGLSLGFSNPAVSIPSGSRLYQVTRARMFSLNGGQQTWYWNWERDPFGLSNMIPPFDGHSNQFLPAANTITTSTDTANYSSPQISAYRNCCDHSTWALGLRVGQTNGTGCSQHFSGSEVCYYVQTQYPGQSTQINTVATFKVAQIPRFAGQTKTPLTDNDTHIKRQHFTATGRELNAAVDTKPLRGFGTQTNSIVATTTSIYKITTTLDLLPKIFPLDFYSGDRILRNISGPGACDSAPNGANCLTDTKYHAACLAINANECFNASTGSQSAANAYGVAPLRTVSSSAAGSSVSFGGGYPRTEFSFHAHSRVNMTGFGILQADLGYEDVKGARNRMMALSYVKPFVQQQLNLAFVLTDNSWAFWNGDAQGVAQWYAVKLPPFPDLSSLDRLTFVRVPVSLYHTTAAKFRVEFGYLENGTATQYYCSPNRLEACSIDSATVSESNPFKWAHESPGYITCSSNRCVAEIPRIPGRIVYSRALFYDNTTNCSLGPCLIETKVLPPQ
jgi:hypothetical protein